MRVRWKDFELPTRLVCDEKTLTSTFGTFIAEPFERGFGMTLGNSLRRVLLSSIEGSAVTWVKFKGVAHEFTTIPGVYEDVTDIVLALKKLVVRVNVDEPRRLKIDVSEKGEVKAAHIIPDGAVEIINPDLHIATLSQDTEFCIEMEVKKGRGYVTADENEREDQELGVIPVDSIFSPVRRVRYRVENTRVGKLTNYDKLVMDIWTNGTISPEMAMVESSKILRKHLNPFVQYFELGKELQLNEKKEEEARKREKYLEELKTKLSMPVSELDLSVRASNCLVLENIKTIGEFVQKSEADLLKVRNFGKTSLKEVKKKLSDIGLSLGMDLETIFGKKPAAPAGAAPAAAPAAPTA
ncbi:MAG: DNA-directed RNA polymerase subunit alpha [Planctomycetes bacterium]|nr:DNA-directed RNA polymerase subunit alpha [Planctomycetota bacterium]